MFDRLSDLDSTILWYLHINWSVLWQGSKKFFFGNAPVCWKSVTPNDSTMTLNTKRSKVPPRTCYINNYLWVRHFILLWSAARRFRVTDHFETSALNDPRMTFNTKRSKGTPYTYDNYPRVPSFNLFRSTANSQPFSNISRERLQNDLEH